MCSRISTFYQPRLDTSEISPVASHHLLTGCPLHRPLRFPFITSTAVSSMALTFFLVPFRTISPLTSVLGTRILHFRTTRSLRQAVSGGSHITPTMPATSSSVHGHINPSSHTTVSYSGLARLALDSLIRQLSYQQCKARFCIARGRGLSPWWKLRVPVSFPYSCCLLFAFNF